MDIELRLESDYRVVIRVPRPAHTGFIVGRFDEESDFLPDIDLSELGARDEGLSRRHAAFVSYRNQPHLLDLGSYNGTYINNVRLQVDKPYPIHSGDIVKFANLSFIIK